MATEFRDQVEAARLGSVFSSNTTAYRAWRRRTDRQVGHQAALTGTALESAVMRLASTHPEYVVVEGRP